MSNNEFNLLLDDNGLPIPDLGVPGSDLRVYVVVAHNYEDLESLYEDMETEGGSLYIPNRVVECVDRGEYLRSTSYRLTFDEALMIRKDPRVLTVALDYEALGVKRVPNWIKTASFNSTNNEAANWPLLAHRTINFNPSTVNYANYDYYIGDSPSLTCTNTSGRISIDLPMYFRNILSNGIQNHKLNDGDKLLLIGNLATGAEYGTISGHTTSTSEYILTDIVYSNPNDYTTGTVSFTIKRRLANADISVTTTTGIITTSFKQLLSYNVDTTRLTTVSMDLTGKNVDYVNFAETPTPYSTNYEYAQNEDGSGYSRGVYYPWESLTITTNNAPNDPGYGGQVYPLGNDHGAHTTSMAAGNTFGFAKDSNIYWCKSGSDLIQWHNNKPVNPLTGIKNPTVMSDSHASMGTCNTRYIAKINYRGVDHFPDAGDALLGTAQWNIQFLYQCRLAPRGHTFFYEVGKTLTPTDPIFTNPSQALTPLPTQQYSYLGNFGIIVQTAVWNSWFKDIAAAGIITITGSDNYALYHDIPGGADYNNYILTYDPNFSYKPTPWSSADGPYPIYYNRGHVWYGDGNVRDDYATLVVGSCSINRGSPELIQSPYNPTGVVGQYCYFRPNTYSHDKYVSGFSGIGPGVAVYAGGAGVRGVYATTPDDSPISGPAMRETRGDSLSQLAVNPYKVDTTGNQTTYNESGVSGASPMFAGIVACMLEKNPRWNQKDVWNWIKNSPKTIESTGDGMNFNSIFGGNSSLVTSDAYTNPLAPTYSSTACDKTVYLQSPRLKDPVIGNATPTPYRAIPYPNNLERYRPTSGATYPRKKSLVDYTMNKAKPTFVLSSNITSAVNGNTIIVTVTTTNVPDGTKVRYIITGRPQPSSPNYSAFTFRYLNNVPVVGDLTITSNSASISLPVTTTDNVYLYFRLDMFPTPHIVIPIN